jgi:hypothetical protein
VGPLIHLTFPEIGHGFIGLIALAAAAVMLFSLCIFLRVVVRVIREHRQAPPPPPLVRLAKERRAERAVTARSTPKIKKAAEMKRQGAHRQRPRALETADF